MKNRRSFLRKLGSGGLLLATGKFILPTLQNDISEAHNKIQNLSLDMQIKDEDFWKSIRRAYTVSPSLVNLNNGGVSPQPKFVQEAVERYNRLCNETPSYYMWRVLDKGREPLRVNMAKMAGCDAEEIAFNRNSTEALETVIFGLQIKKGDEVVLCKQDYPNMKNAWLQREVRDGIVLKWVDLDLPTENDDDIMSSYFDLFTSKTKVLHLTHVINWTGQVLPVKKLVAEAKRRGVEVVVDGAHSFAHLDFKISDLDCDYFGTSLHKWLCAPFGSGLLYVRKEKIKNLFPLFAAPNWDADNIRKFEHLGTRSFAIEQAIGQALIFHEMIGSERKSERLFYLKKYWTDKVKEIPGVGFGTPLSREYSGAISLLQIDGKTNNEVSKALLDKHRIHTVAMKIGDVEGVRITPNVYTLTNELDKLVEAIEGMVI